MAYCPDCGTYRDPAAACAASGAAPLAAAAPRSEKPPETLSFDDLERIEAPVTAVPRAGAAQPELVVMQPLEVVEPMPVIAPLEVVAPMPVVAPVEVPAQDLSVQIEPRFEARAAPADVEPLVHLLLSLTPSGPPLCDPAKGPVAHVVLALDLSASMNRPDKYPVLTEALSGMLYDLRSAGAADVLISVVVFAYGAETIVRAVPARSLDPRDLLASLDRSKLRFGRYTDIVGGLYRSGLIAKESLLADRSLPVRICVLTDGKPQDVEGARDVLGKIAKMPVDVDGLAFGADADVKGMQDLVAGGRGGTVKHVRAETLGEAFGRIAETAQRVVANRALFRLDLEPGVVGGTAFRFRPARHRYGEAAFGDGTKFAADLGTLESDRPYSLLFELRLPRGKDGVTTEIGRASLRIPGADGGPPRVFETKLSIARQAGTEMDADPEVAAARDVLMALAGDDPTAMLKALKVRRRLYEEERRDPQLIAVLDKAIGELEERGSLAKLSASEHAALLSHTCTAGGSSPAKKKPVAAAKAARPTNPPPGARRNAPPRAAGPRRG